LEESEKSARKARQGSEPAGNIRQRTDEAGLRGMTWPTTSQLQTGLPKTSTPPI
jgi:hypothetical protein